VPPSTTATFELPSGREEGVALVGVAGGGARSSVTRTHQELLALHHSWNVQIVWSSFGSTNVAE
jgi:hypothetical protein